MQYTLFFLLLATLASSYPFHTLAIDSRGGLSKRHVIDAQHAIQSYEEAEKALAADRLLDRGPQSVEMLLTTDSDDETVRIWIPLGKRIHPRDYPFLPLHPRTAHIANVLIYPHDQVTNDEKLERTTCMIRGVVNGKNAGSRRGWFGHRSTIDESSVGFQSFDGVVDLEASYSRWTLAGREVESYECF